MVELNNLKWILIKNQKGNFLQHDYEDAKKYCADRDSYLPSESFFRKEREKINDLLKEKNISTIVEDKYFWTYETYGKDPAATVYTFKDNSSYNYMINRRFYIVCISDN